jgi:uncharacterized membrane protein YfcA
VEAVIIYLLLGAFAGLVAGLLGVGGGLIIVPVLVFVFHGQGMAEHLIVHLAVGTSLATIVFTSISSVRAHHQHGAVLWPVFWQLTPGIVVGAWLGALFADVLASDQLRRFFGVFELLVAIQMTFNFKPQPHRQLPKRVGMFGAGSVIGAISAVVGIGGGTMTVPFLVWCNIVMRKAVATSSACGLPIAIAGAIGFIFTGWKEVALPPYSSGYVYWPAFAGIVVASILTAPLGARLAHRLPAAQLKRIFAVLLYILGIRMLMGV